MREDSPFDSYDVREAAKRPEYQPAAHAEGISDLELGQARFSFIDEVAGGEDPNDWARRHPGIDTTWWRLGTVAEDEAEKAATGVVTVKRDRLGRF